MKRLIIIGASGHGKVIADIAMKRGYLNIVFLDDDVNIKSCGIYPVVGVSTRIKEMDGDAIIAIGDPAVRKRMQESIGDERLAVLIHPNAVVAEDVVVGKGTVVMAGAVVNSGSTIGRGCIINTCASVDHDCKLEDYVHVAVGAHIAGHVEVGEKTWIGAGATVINGIRICSDCMIGAGAVVVKEVSKSGTYMGVPARIA